MRSLKRYCQATLAALALTPFPLCAQIAAPGQQPAAAVPTISNDPADQLAANLMILSQRPRDVNALIGAGLSALAIGDGNAALGFLARAEEISPSNGRIKAALGSALLLVERPAEALKLFGEASALGMPEREFARDRGLAYDLRGDSRRAQRDYLIALDYSRDDELVRRYALSLGISGDRDRALTLLDPLLQKQDQAAWRARAFVLAMNGDIRGAEGIAGSVMPGGNSGTMSPFLRRLAGLNAAERALAVNFGMIASDGQQFAQVQANDPFRPVTNGLTAGEGLIPAGEQLGSRVDDQRPVAARVSTDPRRRPGREAAPLVTPNAETAALGSQRIGKRLGPVDPVLTRADPLQVASVTKMTTLPPPDSAARPTASVQPSFSSIFIAAKDVIPVPAARPPVGDSIVVMSPVVSPPAPVVTATPPPAQFEVPPADLSVKATPAPSPSPVEAVVADPVAKAVAGQATAAFVGPPAEVNPSAPITTPPSISPPAAQIAVAAPSPPIATGLGAIIATIEPEAESTAVALPTAAELRATRIAAKRKIEAAAKLELAEKLEKEKRDLARAEAAKNPPRIWVQVAGGANTAGLSSTWKKTRDAAPAVLKGTSAWSTPLNRTNRLLVGPFKSNGEARDMVNKLNKAGLSVFAFTSSQGQEIEKLGAK